MNADTLATAPPARGMEHEDFVPYVQALGRGETLRRHLSEDEAYDALDRILGQRVSDVQLGAFFIAQRVKGESKEEIRGFVRAVRERWMTPLASSHSVLLDLAVPYDGKERTAQLAPAIAFVLAACGLPVLLHGDQGVPTKSGVTPAAVLDCLDVPSNLETPAAERMLDALGVAYCPAAHFMPAWHRLLPMRRQFGLRTVLNTVEKLVNPASACYQVTGFYHTKYIDQMRSVQTGGTQSWIVQGEEGSIEMRAGRKTRLYGVHDDEMHILDPQALGLPENIKVEAGADLNRHVALNREALQNRDTPARAQVVLSAGIPLALFGVAPSFAAGMEAAARALDSGRVLSLLRDAQKFQRA